MYTEKSSHSRDISQSATRNHCITSIYIQRSDFRITLWVSGNKLKQADLTSEKQDGVELNEGQLFITRVCFFNFFFF